MPLPPPPAASLFDFKTWRAAHGTQRPAPAAQPDDAHADASAAEDGAVAAAADAPAAAALSAPPSAAKKRKAADALGFEPQLAEAVPLEEAT